jgi:ClpP class serine protease
VSAADTISVPRTGGTGSIGIVAIHTDVSGAMEKAGVKNTILTFGAKKGNGNPFGPLSDEAFADEMADIDYLGELFVETVARNRGMKASAVRATQAGTYLGPKGVDIGFADRVSSPAAAFQNLLDTL